MAVIPVKPFVSDLMNTTTNQYRVYTYNYAMVSLVAWVVEVGKGPFVMVNLQRVHKKLNFWLIDCCFSNIQSPMISYMLLSLIYVCYH